MRFIIFVIDGNNSSGTSAEMAAIDAFNEKVQANGNWIMAAGIGAPASAIVIDSRNGAGISSSSSLFEGPEHYSGFWIVDCEDPQSAKDLAMEGSRACNRRVELRPFLM